MLVSSKLAKSMAIPERTNIMIDTCRWWTGMEPKQGWADTQQAHLSCFSCWIDRGHRGHEARLGPQWKWHGKWMNTTIHLHMQEAHCLCHPRLRDIRQPEGGSGTSESGCRLCGYTPWKGHEEAQSAWVTTQMPRSFSSPPLLPQADSLVRQSKTFLIRSVGTGIIAPFDSKRFAIVSALNAAPLGRNRLCAPHAVWCGLAHYSAQSLGPVVP